MSTNTKGQQVFRQESRDKLAEALAQYEAALLFAYPEGARGAASDCWNAARQALAAHDAEQAALRDLECPPDPEMVDRALAALSYAEAAKLLADELEYKYQRGIDPHHGEWREAVTLLRRLSAVEAEREALRAALSDAATSLETIGRLAGKPYYGLDDKGEPIPTYMGHNDEVRSYANSRAGAARAAMKGTP